MANTKSIDSKGLRKSLKRAQRKRLKAAEGTLTIPQRKKLRKIREEAQMGVRTFLGKEKKDAG
jgi:hypothetical protein